MIASVGLGLLMLVVLVVARLFGERVRLPSSVVMTVAGVVYALLPGKNLTLDPKIVLYLVVPPLLYSAALNSSLLALGHNLRSVVSLSVILVFATTFALGAAMAAIVPGVSFALGVAFGAAVSPPDPVASLSVARRAHLPPRLTTLIEGEGLLNDATALTAFQVATAAVVAGTGLSFPLATGKFVLAAVGGVALGGGLAVVRRLARPLRRDPLVENAVSLATPFAAYAAGEAIGVSGVLAVVVVALVAGHDAPRVASGAGRLQTNAVWRLVDFLLEGFVFLLIGEQLPSVIRDLGRYSDGTLALALGASIGIVVLIRPVFLVATNATPRWLHARLGAREARASRALTGREIVALSWAGTRGVITLAIAFAIPLRTAAGAPVPSRDLLTFCAYVVVLVTLLGQGLSFAPLVGRLAISADPGDAVRARNEARVAAVARALAELDDIAVDEDVPAQVIDDLRRQLEVRQRRYTSRLAAFAAAEEGTTALRAPGYEAALRARRAVIDAQRDELLRWRDAGRLSDAALRTLQTELDLEERILPESR